MKKLLFGYLFVCLLVSTVSAQLLIGGRSSGMGGTGVANATDLSAVYYNPAGLMKAGTFGLQLSLNPAYTDYQKVIEAFSKSTDPSSLLQDNFANNLSFQGDIAGMVGININKIGLSLLLLPLGNYAADPVSNNTIYINKPANALQGSAGYAVRYDTVLTFGRTFSLPALPIASADTAVNVKLINAAYGTIVAAAPFPSAPYIKGTGSGYGVDLGARTSVSVPMIGSLALGLTLRDLIGQINYKRTQQLYYFNQLTSTISKGAESNLDDKSVTLNPVTVIGAAATIPAINLGLAADVEIGKNDTITHLGAEYPLMTQLLLARAGVLFGTNVSRVTLGAGLNLPVAKVDFATFFDTKGSGFSGWTFNVGFGL